MTKKKFNPIIPNKDLRSECHRVKVHGHPESPSGDPPRCTKCGEEAVVLVLVDYSEYEELNEKYDEVNERYEKLIQPLRVINSILNKN